jgi:hypothetical protein
MDSRRRVDEMRMKVDEEEKRKKCGKLSLI